MAIKIASGDRIRWSNDSSILSEPVFLKSGTGEGACATKA
jgi:hypothetical protein